MAGAIFEVSINSLGALFGYHLEKLNVSPRAYQRPSHPDYRPWKPLRSQPKNAMKVRANGGLFGETNHIEIYPDRGSIRTPSSTTPQRLNRGETYQVGILTIRRR